MKLSVIVPIFNVEAYLDACLKSIKDQTFEDFEVVLVDDGSTDQSAAIAQKYTLNDPRFKYHFKTNGGLSDARNFGIDKASGAWLMFIDSDDYIETDMFEAMIRQQTQTNADVVVCDMNYVYETKSSTFASGGNFDELVGPYNPNALDLNNSACNKLYRASLFTDVRFPIGKLYEDLFTIPLILFKAHKIVKVDQPFYQYRQREDSIVHVIDTRVLDVYEAIRTIQQVLLEQKKLNNSTQAIVNAMYIKHGLVLNTVRIKDQTNYATRINFFHKNIHVLSENYPEWYHDASLKSYSLKNKFIFLLFKHDVFWFAALLLRMK